MIYKLHLAITGLLALGFIVMAFLVHSLVSQNMILADFAKSQLDLNKKFLLDNQLTGITQRAMAEDYPPKKKMSEREWCRDLVCLPDNFLNQ